MGWLFLASAIFAEVSATLSLRMASQEDANKYWYGVVAAGYVAAFTFLTQALAQGMGIGVAYGIWAAAGVALTALASRVLFAEPLTKVMIAGIALIVAGVLLIELSTTH
ncbi:multidrug efflux SMR transporter [Nocardia sp. NPDC005978]|uniref:DMT family transporter n=1 Tax=Nocardia sp. NPDC005978 TaxID=3156725 RepID=UPI0033A42535